MKHFSLFFSFLCFWSLAGLATDSRVYVKNIHPRWDTSDFKLKIELKHSDFSIQSSMEHSGRLTIADEIPIEKWLANWNEVEAMALTYCAPQYAPKEKVWYRFPGGWSSLLEGVSRQATGVSYAIVQYKKGNGFSFKSYKCRSTNK